MACPTGMWSIPSTSPTSASYCRAITCPGTTFGIVGTAGRCTCNVGYGGSVNYVRGKATGCVKCKLGTWTTEVGNGNVCTAAPCTGFYSGTPGACTCAAGYYGKAVYSLTTGLISGCTACSPAQITWSKAGADEECVKADCPAPAYVGFAGGCICADGYVGPVSHVQGQPFGCTPCSADAWAINGASYCTKIPCPAPAFQGTAGDCYCGVGYTGTVKFVNGLATGCALA